jgi:hypothetical protein
MSRDQSNRTLSVDTHTLLAAVAYGIQPSSGNHGNLFFPLFGSIVLRNT